MPALRRLEHDWFDRELPPGVSWGEGSWLHSSHGFLHCRSNRPDAVRIGAHTGFYVGSFFELGPQGRVEIGDYCSIVGGIIRTDGFVRIGSYSFIAHEVVLADTFAAAPPPGIEDAGPRAGVRAGSVGTFVTPDPAEALPARGGEPVIELGENCWIGMRAVLLAGARLGEGCIVGAGAVVDFSAPPYSIVVGNPARVVGTAR